MHASTETTQVIGLLPISVSPQLQDGVWSMEYGGEGVGEKSDQTKGSLHINEYSQQSSKTKKNNKKSFPPSPCHSPTLAVLYAASSQECSQSTQHQTAPCSIHVHVRV